MDPSKKFTTHFVSARFEDVSMVERLDDVADAGEMAPLLA